ncbi:MAG: polysaccharide deacetylase family protein [Candidatus Bathyarchaeota archaeon]|nr:polysaccharide deacetylase family protein [Candidatus Bathyarchaeota archaeon]
MTRISVPKTNPTALTQILELFKLSYSCDKGAEHKYDLLISYCNTFHLSDYRVLCIPSNTDVFRKTLDNIGVKFIYNEINLPLLLNVEKTAKIRFKVSGSFSYDGPIDTLISAKGHPILCRLRGSKIYLLCIDVIEEINRRFAGINLKPTNTFRLQTALNLQSLVPRRVGDLLLKSTTKIKLDPEEYISKINAVDGLSYLLLVSIITATGKPIKTAKFWKNNKKYAFTITHDVDTSEGFNTGIDILRGVERKYAIKSSWNIPTGRYALEKSKIQNLSLEGCEVGSHGFRHDGKLILLDEHKIQQVCRVSKITLEKLGNCTVSGFRSPLLQHSQSIIRAVKAEGYLYDSSLPAWEAHCRTTGHDHGVGTVYPFTQDGLLEIPVTMPQDHQLLKLQGLKPCELLSFWRSVREHIRSIGGLCSVIIHPDKQLFGQEKMSSLYNIFLEELVADKDCWVVLPSELAKWWAARSRIDKIDENDPRNVQIFGGCYIHEYAASDFSFSS